MGARIEVKKGGLATGGPERPEKVRDKIDPALGIKPEIHLEEVIAEVQDRVAMETAWDQLQTVVQTEATASGGAAKFFSEDAWVLGKYRRESIPLDLGPLHGSNPRFSQVHAVDSPLSQIRNSLAPALLENQTFHYLLICTSSIKIAGTSVFELMGGPQAAAAYFNQLDSKAAEVFLRHVNKYSDELGIAEFWEIRDLYIHWAEQPELFELHGDDTIPPPQMKPLDSAKLPESLRDLFAKVGIDIELIAANFDADMGRFNDVVTDIVLEILRQHGEILTSEHLDVWLEYKKSIDFYALFEWIDQRPDLFFNSQRDFGSEDTLVVNAELGKLSAEVDHLNNHPLAHVDAVFKRLLATYVYLVEMEIVDRDVVQGDVEKLLKAYLNLATPEQLYFLKETMSELAINFAFFGEIDAKQWANSNPVKIPARRVLDAASREKFLENMEWLRTSDIKISHFMGSFEAAARKIEADQPVETFVLSNAGGSDYQFTAFLQGRPDETVFPFTLDTMDQYSDAVRGTMVHLYKRYRSAPYGIQIFIGPEILLEMLRSNPNVFKSGTNYFPINAGEVTWFRNYLQEAHVPIQILAAGLPLERIEWMFPLWALNGDFALIYLSPLDYTKDYRQQLDEWASEAAAHLLTNSTP